QHMPETYIFDYSNADRLVKFVGTHPQVMLKRIEATGWKIDLADKPIQKDMGYRRKLLQKIEDWTGWRIGEYKNYKIVAK
ncbi:MAG: glycosyltransferase family 2 protein, partial [Pedobacter sp.]|nr:glycosyltransferase family 2 protein [Pedobacter sp.]